jgi:hypothetical protein
MDVAALFDPAWLSLLSGLSAGSAAENDSVCANGGGLALSASTPKAATKTETDQRLKSDESNELEAVAKVEVKAENTHGATGALLNALAANKDMNAALQMAAAAAVKQAAAAAAAVKAFHHNPASVIAAAQHMTAQAEKHHTAVSSLRIKSKATGGGVTGFNCKTCKYYHDGPNQLCTSCLATKRDKAGTSQSKCHEVHFANTAAALQHIDTLDDHEYAYYIIDHKGDRANHGNGVVNTNVRVRLACHCHYKPSKEQKAKIEAQCARMSPVCLDSNTLLLCVCTHTHTFSCTCAHIFISIAQICNFFHFSLAQSRLAQWHFSPPAPRVTREDRPSPAPCQYQACVSAVRVQSR